MGKAGFQVFPSILRKAFFILFGLIVAAIVGLLGIYLYVADDLAHYFNQHLRGGAVAKIDFYGLQ